MTPGMTATIRRTISSFLFAVAVVISVLGSRSLIDRIENEVSTGRDDLLAVLLDATAQRLEWRSISPSILRSLTFYGVNISDDATAQSVSIGIDIVGLLFGREAAPITFVEVRRGRIAVQSDDAWERLERTLSFLSTIEIAPADIAIRIHEGYIVADRDNVSGELRSIDGELRLGEDRTIRGSLESIATLTDRDREFALSSAIDTDLSSDGIDGGLSVAIDLRRITSSHFELEDQSFRVVMSGSSIGVQRVKSDTPLDLTVGIDTSDEALRMVFRSSDFVPSETFRFRGPLERFNGWIQQPITGEGSAEFGFDGTLRAAEGTIRTVLSDPSSIPQPIPVALTATADSTGVSIASLVISGRTGYAEVRGSYNWGDLGPNARIITRGFSYGASPRVDGTIIMSASTNGVGIAVHEISIDETALFDVAGTYTRLGARGIAEIRVALDENGDARMSGKANIGGIDDVSGEVRCIALPVRVLRGLSSSFGYAIELPPIADDLVVSGRSSFSVRGSDVVVSIPYFFAEDPKKPDRLATIRGKYRNGTITVDQYYLRFAAVRSNGSGLVRFGSNGTVDFETAFRVNGVAYELRGLAAPDGSITIVGPYDIRIRGATSRNGGVRVTAGALDVPIPLGNAVVSVQVDGLFLSRRDWYLTIPDLRLQSVPMPGGGTGSATLAVSITPSDVEIALVSFADPVSELSGTFRFDYRLGKFPEVRGNGRITSLDASEQYRITGRFVPDSLAIDLRFDGAPLRRADPAIRSGALSGAIQVVGSRDSLLGRVFVESNTVRIGAQEARLRMRGFVDDTTIHIRDTEIIAAARTIGIEAITVDRVSGGIRGDLRITAPQSVSTTEVSIRGATDPVDRIADVTWRNLPLSLSIATRTSPSIGENEEDQDPPPRSHVYSLAKVPGRIDLRRDDGAIHAHVLDSGDFVVDVREPLPVTTRATGQITNGMIRLTASDIAIDITAAARSLPEEVISIQKGTAKGSIRVLGPLADPDVYGTLRIRDTEVLTAFSPDAVGAFDAAIILEEKQLRIPRFETRVGSAPVRVAGLVQLSRLALSEFRISLDFYGEYGAHVVSAFGPIDVDGYGRGTLDLTGRPREIDVTGDLIVSSTELGLVSADDVAVDEDTPRVNVDLSFTTGRGVRFIWPAADFPVIRSSLAVGQELELQVDGGAETLALTGSIAIQSGDIFYFDRNFLIRSGKIAFRETEEQFDPRVSARAELREVTPDGPVRIYLVAEDQRLSEFGPRFESNPPLGGTEIVAILGGNILQQGAEDNTNLSTALLSTSDIVTQFGVFREFENAVRTKLDLDLFAIRTGVIQNLVLTAITPTDETTQQIAPSLGNYLNNTSIFMGRYIGESVFGQAILQMRSADFGDRTEGDGIQRIGGVLIDSEISLEWQTPFFLLEWSLAPENPEELFIRDNTFTFLWSFTY